MKLTKYVALLMTVLALGALPAVALAGGHGKTGAPGQNKTTTTTTTTTTTPSKAYGTYCKNESKKHVAGQKGTPFSQCVTAAAHAAKNSKTSASAACMNESKKHVAGQKGTPFSECVTAVAKLRAAS
jgi:hypothetical protein